MTSEGSFSKESWCQRWCLAQLAFKGEVVVEPPFKKWQNIKELSSLPIGKNHALLMLAPRHILPRIKVFA
jgi:hypothetical protein